VSLVQTMRIALGALRVNKLRSALTMLGIIIGVGAVIAMVAVGSGAQARVAEQIQSLGSNLIIILSGSVTSGVQTVDNSSRSSKLTEYRDLRDNFYLPGVAFSLMDPANGGYFNLFGRNVSRNDQTILARAGRAGVWSIEANWVGIPHNFSNKAVTPYINRGGGLFTVPATVPIVAATTPIPPPCGVGILCEERALGFARA